MIINTLADYYDYLVEKQEIPAFGWSNEKVSHAILLNKDGQIASIVSLKKTNKKGKEYVEKMEVPEHKVKTSGIVPQFMCDSESSLLGIVVTKEAERKNKEVERAKKSFMASVDLHHRVLEGVDSDIAKRVLAYFDTWNPEEAYQNKHVISFLKESGIKSFLIFADADTGRAAFEDPKIREAWIRHRNRENADVKLTLCLDKGDYELPERLHPKIKGIPKANPSGASLISFNSNAFESYGKNEAQGFNAPISKINTFKYSSVLNYLLSNKRNTVNLGNTTVVFWAEEAEHECESCFDEMIECEITEDDIKSLYNSLAIGNPIEWKKSIIAYDNPFYVLGVTPNNSRISIRFFLQNKFGRVIKNVLEHYLRLEIIQPYNGHSVLSLSKLMNETVRFADNDNKKDNKIDKQSESLREKMLTSLLLGGSYPAELLQVIISRIRAEQSLGHNGWEKAAIIKAFLLNNYKEYVYLKEVATVSLNMESRNEAYVLGRLFAVLEDIQRRASKTKLNVTIKDRFFSSAAATPRVVFPQLLKLSQSHMKKLNESSYVHYDKLIGELIDKLENTSFPPHLSLEDQGTFYLGYYHQERAIFTGNKQSNIEEEEAE